MELDQLKSVWKNVPEQNIYKKDDIFKMMKKKSSSTVKWLFTFTLIEFIIVLLFTILSLVKGKILTSTTTLNDLSSYNNYITGSIVTIFITTIFLFIIYRTYKKIDINNSIADLINQIIKFRRMVNLFIFIILVSLILISIPYYFHIGQEIYISKFGETFNQNKADLIGYISVAIAIIFLLAISTIYYVVIYFLFLKKLSKNLKQLKEII